MRRKTLVEEKVMPNTATARRPWVALYLGATAIGSAVGVWLTMTPPGIELVLRFLNWILV